MTDVGGLYLGFGVMLAWAAIRPSRQLVVPLCSGWIVAQALHFAFHVGHLTGFTTSQAVGQTAGLGLYLVLAAIPIALLRRG